MRLGMGLGLGNLLSGQPLTGFPNDFSFNFDGSNDYLDCGKGVGNALGDSCASFSYSVWFKANDTNVDDGIISFTDSLSGTTGVTLRLSSNRIVWTFKLDGSYENLYTGFTSTEWNHVAVVYDGSNYANTKLYLNGSAVQTAGSSSFPSSQNFANTNLYIGTYYATNYTFNGLIDEVAVWNTVLSADDVAKIASKPVDFSKASTYATDRTANLKLWLRAGDKVLPEEDTSIARSDFYTDFDGTNDYVQVSPIPTATATGSACFWVKNSADNGEAVLTFGDANADSYFGISIGDGSTGLVSNELVVIARTVTGTNSRAGFATTGSGRNILVDGNWHHVAVTGDGSEYKIYIDGVSQSINVTSGSGNNGAWSNVTGVDEFFIGKHSANGSDAIPFEGQISNLSLYQTALDAQTIKQFAKSRFTPMRDNRFSVVDFDGSDDKIAFTRQTFTGAFSIIFWFNGDVNTDYQRIFDDSQDSGVSNDIIVKDTNGAITIRINGNYKAQISSVPNNEWSHLAYTRDGSGNIKSYLNGVASGTASSTDSFSLDAIGDGCVMSMASASMYNVEKSADEVYAIYQQGITYDESSLSGLVGYWRMGDDTSKAYPTIADSSSNSNDGTITNGASDDIVQQMVAGYDMGAFESTGEETLELVTNGDMSSAPTISGVGLTYYNASGALQSDAIGGVSNTYKIILGASESSCNAKIIPNDSLLVGELLSVSAKIYNPSGGFTSVEVRGINTSGGGISYGGSTTTKDTWITYTGTMTYDGTNAHPINVAGSGGSTNDVFYVDDFSVTKVLQSADLSDTYPAIIDVNEPVLGAEAVTSISNQGGNPYETFSGASGNFVESMINSSGSGQAFTNEVGANTTSTYKIVISLTVNSGSVPTLSANQNDGTYTSGDFKTGTTHPAIVSGTNTYYTTFSATDKDFLFLVSGTTNLSDVTISVKEVSGNVGTMTNQDSADLVYSSVLPDQSFLATGVNSAYNFINLDGADQKITIAGGGVVSGDATMSLWIKTSHSGEAFILSRDDNSTRSYYFAKNSSNYLLFKMQDGSGNNTFVASSDAINDGEWHHIVAVVDVGTSITLYSDGSQVAQTTSSVPSSFNTATEELYIGAFGDGSGFYNGDVGQTAIWNKALSATEVSAIYTLGRNGNLLDSYSDNLVGNWAMSALDASTGLSDSISTIYDRSGNSNHGTPTNADAGDLASSPNAEPNGYAKGDTNRSTTIP